MNCKQCGMEFPQDAAFCPNCGMNASQESFNQPATPQQENFNQAPAQQQINDQAPPQNGFVQAPPQQGYGQMPPQNGYAQMPPQGGFNPNMPPYGQMPPQSPYGMPNSFAIPGDPGKNGLAVASMILGIVSFVCCSFFGVGSILAVIFGIIGTKSQKKGMAITGLILGGLSLLGAVLYIILVSAGAMEGFFSEFSFYPGLDY